MKEGDKLVETIATATAVFIFGGLKSKRRKRSRPTSLEPPLLLTSSPPSPLSSGVGARSPGTSRRGEEPRQGGGCWSVGAVLCGSRRYEGSRGRTPT
ncbi:hypothetical protein BDA96_07G075900 [Sorghum bicolor]|jgi:hypothetical protein|uniref:Uncharacterized protein n=2 Tax=Sorghum bicolor TaxID=4558 RepID=A0A921U9S4_SORBI|nr:hypothetical protein BDA96_07G075900 [Sorghum bicolor]KXG24689.1 hypothetical protein SORBI_3007G072700 [Sorghum bicolor]